MGRARWCGVSGLRNLDNADLTLSMSEAAAALGVSKGLLYELRHRGELPEGLKVLTLGRRLRVSTASLRRVLDEDAGAA